MLEDLITKAKKIYLQEVIRDGESRERSLLRELNKQVSEIAQMEVDLELQIAQSDTYTSTSRYREDKRRIEVARISLNNAFAVREVELKDIIYKKELLKKQLEELSKSESDFFTVQVE